MWPHQTGSENLPFYYQGFIMNKHQVLKFEPGFITSENIGGIYKALYPECTDTACDDDDLEFFKHLRDDTND